VALFGDSNTDFGYEGDVIVEASYISGNAKRLAPGAPNGSHQLAGLLEALSTGEFELKAINHGLGYSGSGVGFDWAPGARYISKGITRFEAEVLGRGRPTWDGDTGIPRIEAFVPTSADYAYVSIGTNDSAIYFMSPDSTLADLSWMADQWVSAGNAPSHLIITTLPPFWGHNIPLINAGIRALARAKGLSLLDLSAHLSTDDGQTWAAPELTVGDYLHYSTPVRQWIASEIAAIIQAR
jgi:lysophospholipase L1-like esterase